MNREIKFRAWSDNLKDSGEMYYQYLSDTYNPLFSPAGYGLLNPSIKVMQYTGLKDKNGVEIYEGDIVKWEADDRGSLLSQIEIVEFKNGSFILNCPKYNTEESVYEDMGIFTNEYSVIGNIYQNKELIK